jgi:SAM-dependent methyltransferase
MVCMEAALAFGASAEEYDKVRPGYPGALVDAACEVAGLAAGDHVLEVGCGTGKLTTRLAGRGLTVEAIDPSAEMLAVARANLAHVNGSVSFEQARFEDARFRSEKYPALFAATSFHWVDPSVSWSRAARLLRPGGVLALLSHIGGGLLDFEPDFWPAWCEVVPEVSAYQSCTPDELWKGAAERTGNVSELWGWLHLNTRIARPEASTWFGEATLHTVAVESSVTATDAIALMRTQSAYLRLDELGREHMDRRVTEIVDRAGGIYQAPLHALLVTAVRR